MPRQSRLAPHKEAIAGMLARGHTHRDIAATFGMRSHSAVQEFIKRHLTDEISRPARATVARDDDDTQINEIPVIFRDYSDRDHQYILPLGDVHKGAATHNKPKWREWLAYLGSADNTSALFIGDGFNAAIPNSKSDIHEEKMPVSKARIELHDELEPVADRIDAMCPGNHEERIWRAVGDEPLMSISKALDIPYFRAAALVVYKVGNIYYDVFVKHGTGGGQVGARANRLARQQQQIIADVYISGHTHSKLVFPQEVFWRPPGTLDVVRRRMVFVSSGSFLNYESYAAAAGYAPTSIGAPRIRLNGERKDVHVSI